MSRLSIVFLAAAASVVASQHQYLPWELQNAGGSNPAWYAPKQAGFASQPGSSLSGLSASSGPSSSYLAPGRQTFLPNYPGYPTFGTVQPVGPGGVAPKSGGIPYSRTTTYKPKSALGSKSKPTNNADKGRSNLDKYLPLMKKKKVSTTSTTTVIPKTTTRRRRPAPSKTPARRSTVTTTTSTTRRPTTTTVPRTTTTTVTTPKPKTSTVVDESAEWENLVILEKKTTAETTTTVAPTTTTVDAVTVVRKKEEKLVKGPIVPKGRPVVTSTTPIPEEEEVEEFNLLGFLWDKSELLASIKNMIKQLKTSIDEAGLEEDVRNVSDHLKNTIKTFASKSPVNEQLGRLFERAQNADIKLD